MIQPSTTAQKNKSFRLPRFGLLSKRLFRWLEHVFATVGLVTIIYHVGFDLSVMVSDSMAPTLRGTSAENGDWVLTEKLSYWYRDPARWEIVTFQNDFGAQVMKRVIGLPGETVEMRERKELRVTGQPVEFPSYVPKIQYLAYGNLSDAKPVSCGEGYYLLGDDTKDSDDSRFLGPLASDRLRGRAWIIVWPPSRIGFVR